MSNGLLTLALPPELLEEIVERAAALVLERLEQQQKQSPYLTVPEAAAYLRCSRQRIYDLLSAGKLTRHKDGRRTLLERAELDAHLAAVSGPGSRRGEDWINGSGRATVTHPDNSRG